MTLIRELILGISFALIAATSYGQTDSRESLGVPSGQIRGYALINKDFANRMVDIETFQIESTIDGGYSFADLLGSFSGSPPVYINGKPNAVNTLLWNYIFEIHAKHMAEQACGIPTSLRYTLIAGFNDVLTDICAASIPESDREGLLVDLWDKVMGYDGTYDDFQAYLSFFLQPDVWQLSGSERIQALLLGLWSSPGFVLKS